MTTGTLVLTRLHKKADLLETNLNCMKDKRFVWMKISFNLDTISPMVLGGRSIVVVRQ